MRFPYLSLPVRGPIPSLRGTRFRHRPVVPVYLIGPGGTRFLDGNLDSGSDDSLFPSYLVPFLGIDLSGAADGGAGAVGGRPIRYRYALVTLRVADGSEACEWDAIVGFIDAPLR